MELRTKLNDNKVKMETNKKKLQNAYLVQKELYELAEKNRIYDELEAKSKRSCWKKPIKILYVEVPTWMPKVKKNCVN